MPLAVLLFVGCLVAALALVRSQKAAGWFKAAGTVVLIVMAIPVGADGHLSWDPATTAAGDSVTLRAELDCTVIVSACPQDIVPINGGNPTSLAIEVLAG